MRGRQHRVREGEPSLQRHPGTQTLRAMLVLDKERALDRMVWLSQRHGNAVPEFLRPSTLRWTVDAGGRRALAGEVVLRPSVLEPARQPSEPEVAVMSS